MGDRCHGNIKELKGAIIPLLNRTELETRRPWIGIRTEDIVHPLLHCIQDTSLPINGDFITPSNSTQVIQPIGMIIVLMRQENSIYTI